MAQPNIYDMLNSISMYAPKVPTKVPKKVPAKKQGKKKETKKKVSTEFMPAHKTKKKNTKKSGKTSTAWIAPAATQKGTLEQLLSGAKHEVGSGVDFVKSQFHFTNPDWLKPEIAHQKKYGKAIQQADIRTDTASSIPDFQPNTRIPLSPKHKSLGDTGLKTLGTIGALGLGAELPPWIFGAMGGADLINKAAHPQETVKNVLQHPISEIGNIGLDIAGLPLLKGVKDTELLQALMKSQTGQTARRMAVNAATMPVTGLPGVTGTLRPRTQAGGVGKGGIGTPRVTEYPTGLPPSSPIDNSLGINDIKISYGDKKEPLAKRITEGAKSARNMLEDKYLPIERATKGKNLLPEDNPRTLLKSLSGSSDIANARIERELAPIYEQVDNVKDFDKFLVAKHGNELNDLGIGKRGDRALLELHTKYGDEGITKMQNTASQLYQYQLKNWKALYDAGYISKEGYEAGLKYKAYIPFDKVLNDAGIDVAKFGSKSVNAGTNPVKRIKQGLTEESEIKSPLESIVGDTYATTYAVGKNEAMRALASLGEDVGITTLRSAENVNERISIYSKLKELRPVQNRLARIMRTDNKRVKRLEVAINRLEKKGLHLKLKDKGMQAPEQLKSGVTIKAKRDEVIFGDNDEVIGGSLGYTKPGQTKYATSKNKGEQSTKKFIDALITDPNRDILALKKQVATRENKLGGLLDELQSIKDSYNQVKSTRSSLREDARLLADAQSRGKAVFNTWKDGVKQVHEAPKDIVEAIKGIDEEQLNKIVEVASVFSKALRAGATTFNVGFAIPNVARDQFSAAVNSKYGGLPGIDFVSGLASVLKKDNVYWEWMESGASQSGFFSQDRTMIQRTVNDLTGGKWARRARVAKNPLELLRALGEYSEKSSRVGVYGRAKKGAQGQLLLQKLGVKENPGLTGRNAILDAMVESREATVDFARRGSKMQAANALIPFLNARLQGSLKFVQSFKRRPVQTMLMGGAIVGLPAAILYAHNSQYPEYDDIPQYIKDTNFVIMTGKQDMPFVKVPKGEIGQIFGNPVESFMAHLKGKDENSFADVAKTLGVALSPVNNIGDVLPTIGKVPYELIANYDTFRDRNIVSPYQDSLPPELQFNNKTSESAKFLGKLLNTSPAKVEHAITGFTAGVGKQALQASDYLGFGKKPDTAAMPVLDRFMGEPKDLTATTQKLYEQLDKNTQTKAKENYDIKQQIEQGDYSGLVGMKKQAANALIKSVTDAQIKEVLPPTKKAIYGLSKDEMLRLYKSNTELTADLLRESNVDTMKEIEQQLYSTAVQKKWKKTRVVKALEALSPIYGMDKETYTNYMDSASEQDKARVKEALNYYISVIKPKIKRLGGGK